MHSRSDRTQTGGAIPDRLIHSMRYKRGGTRSEQSSWNSDYTQETQQQLPLQKLYGRDTELEVLRKLLEKARKPDPRASGPQVVLISGKSGTGKSTLVEQAFLSERSDNLLFGMGKFEMKMDPKPFAALLGAVADLCRHAFHLDQQQQSTSLIVLEEPAQGVEATAPSVQSLVMRLEDELNEEVIELLSAVIPELATVFDELSNAMITLNEARRERFRESSRSQQGLEKLKYSLRLLLKALATPETPVVLCLDDIHFMDVGTLSILKTIVVDSHLTNFLFVGVSSDDDNMSRGTESNDVAKWIEELKDDFESPLTKPPIWIPMEDLDQNHVSSLLSDLLRVSVNNVQDLSELVHQRTNGNAFHILQLLDTLQREELLTKPLGSIHWTWQIDTIRNQTSLCDNVVELVHRKMAHLPPPVQAVLKVCAMLGSKFSESILSKLHGAIPSELVTMEGSHQPNENLSASMLKSETKINIDESSEFFDGFAHASSSSSILLERRPIKHDGSVWTLPECMQTLVDEGILEELRRSRYKFVHNQLCQAALRLVGDSPMERAETHAKIGICLWEGLGLPENLDKVYLHKRDHRLFVCTDHMNLGRSCLKVKQNNLGVDLARLNNQTSKRAAAYSAFVPAIEYLNTGIDTLTDTLGSIETCWTQYYDLCLEMFTSLAEMSFCAGRLEECAQAAEAVQNHAKSVRDALEANMIYSDSLGAQTQYTEMLDLSLTLLKDLGESLPSKPRRFYTKRVLERTKKLLESLSIDVIMGLPICAAGSQTAVLRILYSMNVAAQNLERFNFAAVVKCRMIELTVQHGLSDMAAPALAAMSNEVISRLDDISLGVWLARLAVKVLEKEKSFQKHAAKVLFNTNTVLHWREPLSITVDHWIDAHKKAMQAGDSTTAFLSATGYGMVYFYSGLPLDPLVSDVENFGTLMEEYNNKMQLLQNVPLLQTLLNLTGQSNDILEIHQGAAKKVRDRVGWESRTGVQGEWSYAMQLAFYCEEYARATEYYKKVEPLNAGLSRSLPLYHARVFFFTLICIHNAKRETVGKKMKWRNEARRHYNVVREWVLEQKAINVTHKLMILDAAMFTLEHSRKISHDQDISNAFNKAIVAATKTGFFQDAALAAQLASRAVVDTGTRDRFFGRACEFYLRWGAKGVVDYLCKKPEHSEHSYEITEVETLSSSAATSSRRHLLNGFRSRTHYDRTLREEHQSLNMESNVNIASNPSVSTNGNSSRSVSKFARLSPPKRHRNKTV